MQSQPVTLGVRPEHTDLSDKGVSARVDVSEMMGSSVHLHVNADGRDVIIIVPTIEMKDSTARPEVASKVENMDQYTTIYVGFPIWWYTAPTIISRKTANTSITFFVVLPR